MGGLRARVVPSSGGAPGDAECRAAAAHHAVPAAGHAESDAAAAGHVAYGREPPGPPAELRVRGALSQRLGWQSCVAGCRRQTVRTAWPMAARGASGRFMVGSAARVGAWRRERLDRVLWSKLVRLNISSSVENSLQFMSGFFQLSGYMIHDQWLRIIAVHAWTNSSNRRLRHSIPYTATSQQTAFRQ